MTMLSNVIEQGDVNRRRRRLVMRPMSLIRPDRARSIDRIIDYFGGSHLRTAPVPPFRGRSVPGRDTRPAWATRP